MQSLTTWTNYNLLSKIDILRYSGGPWVALQNNSVRRRLG